jgi:hypothetical protein
MDSMMLDMMMNNYKILQHRLTLLGVVGHFINGDFINQSLIMFKKN